ncbi:MAG: hypothetical protein JSS49_29255 [Planctomycetes bacterium]|nr:hypothetical protein [Planctomycetota bacterium]
MKRGVRSLLRCACLALCLSLGAVASALDKPEKAVPAVAVLDFVNRAPGDGHDWLAKGLADLLMTDLSVSPRLSIVHREKIHELAQEFELATRGILDEESAPRLGKTAHANWVVFGSYRREGDQLGIEALLIDVDHQKTLRLERVDGPFGEVFRLGRELTKTLLTKLDVTMTAKELDQVARLQTCSTTAFEHHARCLTLFDRGLWYDALGEAMLARKADSSYLMARARVAQLYFEVGDPEHSLAEYERLIELDEQDQLPDSEYFKMAMVLELSSADDMRVESMFERIKKRNAAYDVPFTITDPPPPLYDGWESKGGQQKVYEIARQHEAYLESMERLAGRRLREGRVDDAAKLYSQICHFTWTHGMALVGGAPWSGLNAKVDRYYPALYWQLVRENRDAHFYLPGVPNSFYLLSADGVEVDQDVKPTHGYARQTPACWLAPPDYEIDRVEYAVLPRSQGEQKFVNGKNLQVDFVGIGCADLLSVYKQFPLDGEWRTMSVPPGVRALKTFVHLTDRWKFRFHLRKWSGNPAVARSGASLQLNIVPEGADFYLNGKKQFRTTSGVSMHNVDPGTYEIEVRWEDGRRRSKSIQVEPRRRSDVFFNANLDPFSTDRIAPPGSEFYLFVDHGGRVWLVWDDSMPDGYMMQINQQSNLYCATTLDGVTWTPPRRLPVSSFACDRHPVLQQDRQGIFWLAWISNRGSDPSTRRVWIASSPNGVDWSFPHQVALPEADPKHARWNPGSITSFGFAIDHRDEFWLVVQGKLLRSDDAVTWKTESILNTVEMQKDNLTFSGKSYHLNVAANNELLLIDDSGGRTQEKATSMLWRRQSSGEWHSVGGLLPPPVYSPHGGSAVPQPDGSVVTVIGATTGIHVREFDNLGRPSDSMQIACHVNQPFHPALAVLPDGRYLVVYGTPHGIMAAVFQQAR